MVKEEDHHGRNIDGVSLGDIASMVLNGFYRNNRGI